MNDGKCLKLMFSKDPDVSKLIEKGIESWPYGYCKHLTSKQQHCDQSWLIEIPSLSDEDSTKTIIDAYLHTRCGFSYFDIDDADMNTWLSSGTRFNTLIVEGKNKELPYLLWRLLLDIILYQKQSGFNVGSVLLTAQGTMISFEELCFYYSIVKGLGIDVIPNSCLFISGKQEVKIKIHLALTPRN